MPWFWQDRAPASPPPAATVRSPAVTAPATSTTPPPCSADGEHNDGTQTSSGTSNSASLARTLASPVNLLATATLTTIVLSLRYLYTTRLRRIPNTAYLPANYLLSRPSRSMFGPVTSVGDPDNFRLYHTPGGFFLGWHWLRAIPTARKELSGQTLHIRIAGIDAPEMAHFGRPAQPYADVALDWLTKTLKGQKVRVYTLRRDQYERVVATAFLRRGAWGASKKIVSLLAPWTHDKTQGPLFTRDVGLEMIRAGWATVYEASFGAEFGEKGMEEVYREAEKRAKLEGRGIWERGGRNAQRKGIFDGFFAWLSPRRTQSPQSRVDPETPRQYKTRMAALDAEAAAKVKAHTKR